MYRVALLFKILYRLTFCQKSFIFPNAHTDRLYQTLVLPWMLPRYGVTLWLQLNMNSYVIDAYMTTEGTFIQVTLISFKIWIRCRGYYGTFFLKPGALTAEAHCWFLPHGLPPTEGSCLAQSYIPFHRQTRSVTSWIWCKDLGPLTHWYSEESYLKTPLMISWSPFCIFSLCLIFLSPFLTDILSEHTQWTFCLGISVTFSEILAYNIGILF